MQLARSVWVVRLFGLVAVLFFGQGADDERWVVPSLVGVIVSYVALFLIFRPWFDEFERFEHRWFGGDGGRRPK